MNKHTIIHTIYLIEYKVYRGRKWRALCHPDGFYFRRTSSAIKFAQEHFKHFKNTKFRIVEYRRIGVCGGYDNYEISQ
jgi:hypothetical protein